MSVTRAAAHRATHGALTGVRGRCVRGNARRWYGSGADNRQQQQAWTTGCRCAGGACACSTTSMRAMRREGVRIPRRGTRTEAKKGFLFGELEDVKRDAEGGDESSSAKSVRWSEPLAIAKYPAPCLRAKNAPVECFDANLEALSKAMFKIMYETIGCGLAAPQVGVNYRMMVYNEAGEPGKGREVVLCNPKIVKYSKETDLFEEGCLSFPKMYADVEVRIWCISFFGCSFFNDARFASKPVSDTNINIR